MRHFLTLKDISSKELNFLIDKGIEIKNNPEKFSSILSQKTMLMIFAKPSLRTRISFEVGIHQLGGQGLFLSPLSFLQAHLYQFYHPQ